MATVEKIWTGDAKMQYPKQWIVLADLEDDHSSNKVMGVVHTVTPDKSKAYETAMELKNTMRRTVVVEGFNNEPHIGDFTRWGL